MSIAWLETNVKTQERDPSDTDRLVIIYLHAGDRWSCRSRGQSRERSLNTELGQTHLQGLGGGPGATGEKERELRKQGKHKGSVRSQWQMLQ